MPERVGTGRPTKVLEGAWPGRSALQWTDGDAARGWAVMERVAAVAGLLILGLRINLPQGLTVGYAFALAFAPVWLSVVRRYRRAPTMFVLGVLMLLSGFVLTALSAQTHTISVRTLSGQVFLLIGTLAGAGFMLWTRSVIGVRWTVAVYAVGLLLGVSPNGALYDSNPWKYGYAAAASVLILSLAGVVRRRWGELLVLTVLAVVSSLTDARSAFGLLLLTILAVAWQMRPAHPKRSINAASTALAVAGIFVVVYNLGRALILDGYLGQTTQQRSIQQVHDAGSLLLGARPELGATVALMEHQPRGFGLGAVPNLQEILIGKSGMIRLGYQPNNGYVENYMFGSSFELHSIFGDLWAHYGVVGVAASILFVTAVVVRLVSFISTGKASAVLVFVAAQALWNVAFSPLYSSAAFLMLLLGLLWEERSPRTFALNGIPVARRPYTLSTGRNGRRGTGYPGQRRSSPRHRGL